MNAAPPSAEESLCTYMTRSISVTKHSSVPCCCVRKDHAWLHNSPAEQQNISHDIQMHVPPARKRWCNAQQACSPLWSILHDIPFRRSGVRHASFIPLLIHCFEHILHAFSCLLWHSRQRCFHLRLGHGRNPVTGTGTKKAESMCEERCKRKAISICHKDVSCQFITGRSKVIMSLVSRLFHVLVS